jgi:hypothetical protein
LSTGFGVKSSPPEPELANEVYRVLGEHSVPSLPELVQSVDRTGVHVFMLYRLGEENLGSGDDGNSSR